MTDAPDIDPTDAGNVGPADAGDGDPADAVRAHAVEPGRTTAAPADAESTSTGSAGDDGAPLATRRDDLVSAEERTVDPAVAEARREVGTALAALADVEDRPAAEQVTAFDEAYETLQATLARIDEH